MRGGDNLSIQISADTSKLRAELAKAQAEVRGFSKELRKAADAGDTKRIEQFSKEVDIASRSVAGFKRDLRGTGAAVADATKEMGAMGRAAGALNTSLGGLAKGFIAGVGLSAVASALGKVKDELLELKRMSLSTGFDPGTLKAFNETAEDTGSEAGSGYKALIKLSQAFAEVRTQAKSTGQAVGGAAAAVKVMRGSAGDAATAVDVLRGSEGGEEFGVAISRGGQKMTTEINSAAAALKILRVTMANFDDTIEGQRAALQAVIDGFARLRKEGKIDQANLAAQQLFGKGLREIVPVLDEISKQGGTLASVIAELKTKGQYPDEATIARAQEYQRMLKQVSDQVDIVGYSFLRSFGPDMVAFLAEFEARILTTRKEIDGIVSAGNAMDEAFVRGIDRVIAWGVALDESLVKGWNRVAEAASAAATAIGQVPTNVGGGPDPAGLFASGGTVPGRGNGDTVPALLTPGEFVVRKSAVRHYGTDLLRALNSQRYALGGLVDRLHTPTRGFAEGGLVSATTADGVSVNLHFPGGTFALRGDKGIVAGLTREARRSAMLSAGRLAGIAA